MEEMNQCYPRSPIRYYIRAEQTNPWFRKHRIRAKTFIAVLPGNKQLEPLACVDRFLAHLKPGSKCTLREEAYFISHEGWKLYPGLDEAWDFTELPTNEATLQPEEKSLCLYAEIGGGGSERDYY